nr:MAG TPA: hypothetical protein [Caudoviricetes sp.]
MNALVNGGEEGGFGAGKAPAQRLRTDTAKPLIAEREKESVRICTVMKEV